MSLRVGSVPYVVGRPLDRGLENAADILYQQAVPAELVQSLRDSRLDAALVSSIELFRRPGYGTIEGLAVAGQGTVDSVQVFLRRPIEKVRRIALDPSSRAAAALVRVLLAERDGGAPEYLEVPIGVDPRTADADAWLRIGDRALRETWLEELSHWNPSQVWTQQTGLPFVFALWLFRSPATIESLLPEFHRAAERGSAALEEIAEQGAQELQLPLVSLRNYLLKQCVFQLGTSMSAALECFGQRAQALGLTSEPPDYIPPTPQRAPETHGTGKVSCPD
jgi:chorismate dehydratase